MADKKKQTKKLTPMDIHDQEFKKRGLSGYDRHEVDAFLDRIVDDYGDALDETVDLKNKITQLNHQVEKLQAEVTRFHKNESAAKAQLADAHVKAQEIINTATQQAHNETAQAKVDTEYQKQQLDTIKADYDRVKKEVAGYRRYIQELLQQAIKNLDDEKWQKALDKYFSTERFYPPDGAEPIMLTDAEEVVDEDDDDDVTVEVDNDGDDEVNFDEDTADDPKPMAGDSSNSETVNLRENENAPIVEPGAQIIFPDSDKNHK
ncbi:DivIVA domain-containing protein [Lactobacillus sp. B4005]|uniref:DivIVA domain-containing protein n=1 Tax=Lactobacillus sp. B4005 TaxID=2818031 RepID=UPI00226A7EB6|nr:DivIVA domain-containing protein [Lactobacillus sp. B4005]